VSPADRGHPSDAEREARSAPALAEALRALGAGDAAAFAALLRDDAAWLGPEGRFEGAGAAAQARRFASGGAGRWWADPQPKGAHAVLRWGGVEGAGAHGALVVEVRGDRLVLVCEVP
jgi:hypothetical protein